ncbi:GL24142 [Drosophila persimilis]|uniref:GL24142 n=1 Tax=Drosophila persimilis TaxID=7234 RepID=B4GUS9_DROPE|nr:GL24142 [Drosophila persimilis]
MEPEPETEPGTFWTTKRASANGRLLTNFSGSDYYQCQCQCQCQCEAVVVQKQKRSYIYETCSDLTTNATEPSVACGPRFGLHVWNSCSPDRPPLPLVKAFWKRRILEGISAIPHVPRPQTLAGFQGLQGPTLLPHRGLFDVQISWVDFQEQQEERTAEELKAKRRKWRDTLFMDDLTDP